MRYWLILIIGLLCSICCVPKASAQAVVQTKSNFCNPANSCSATFTSNNTAHNSIQVAIKVPAGRTVTITDSHNTYKPVPDAFVNAPSGNEMAMYSVQNIAAGANTVTVSVSGAAVAIILGIAESSGLSQTGSYIDQVNVGSGTGTTGATGSITTSNSGQIVFSIADTNHAQDAGSFTSASPWTGWELNGGTGFGTSDRMVGEYQVNVGGTFSGNLGWTTAANFGALIISYESTLTAAIPPTITSANSTNFILGDAFAFQATATGSRPISFTETGPLPSGITFSPSGILSGTATHGGVFPITINATNGNAPDAHQPFTITIYIPPTCGTLSLPLAWPVLKNRNILSDSTVPNMGNGVGSGNVVTDTTYYAPGIRTLRITDTATNGGTASKSEGAWNCDATKFSTTDDNGNTLFWSFNPSIFPSTSSFQPLLSQPNTGTDVIVTTAFSPTNRSLLFMLVLDNGDNHAKFASYDFSTSTYTVLHDPQSDIPSIGPFGNNLGVTPDGNCLSSNIDGIQDERRYYFIWCAAGISGRGPGSRWLDGSTGTISGSWGPTGTITSNVRWGGHNWGGVGLIDSSIITIGTCLSGSPCTNNGDGIVWDIAEAPASALQFFSINTSDYPVTIAGHLRLDGSGNVADDSVINGAALDRTLRTIDPTKTNFNLSNSNRIDLIPVPRNPDTFDNDVHTSWPSIPGSLRPFYDMEEYFGGKITSISRSGNVVTVNEDQELFCTTSDSVTIKNVTGAATSFNGTFPIATFNSDCTQFTFSQTGANESGTVDITSSAVPIVTHAWDREFIGVSTDGSDIIYRFFHTYGDSLTSPNFTLQTSFRTSAGMKYVLWHTDWKQTLGLDGAGVNRTDVFLTEMPQGNPFPPQPPSKLVIGVKTVIR